MLLLDGPNDRERAKLETFWHLLVRLGINPHAFRKLPEGPVVGKAWLTDFFTPEQTVRACLVLLSAHPEISGPPIDQTRN